MVRTYEGQDRALNQVSVDRPFAENVKLMEATLHAAVHIDLDHSQECALNVSEGEILLLWCQCQATDEPICFYLVKLLAEHVTDVREVQG